ncbi:MAG TPA: IS1595 family transposase [Pyrinomonadaceae bacterium]|nr:IS1595 family transposase [Pyrinomonadaceae bacterium]
MKGEKRYYRRSKISESKFRSLVDCFAQDLSAADTAHLTGVTRKSVTTIFLKIRQRLAEECRRGSPFEGGRLKLTEAHACTRCACGRRGCGTNYGKPVFSLLAFDAQVYTELIPDCKKAPLRAVIRGRPVEDAILRNNGWSGYDGLVDIEYEKAFLVKKDWLAPGPYSPNEIDSFWSFARRRLEKFNGVPNRTFPLHLKECEWRYNHRDGNLFAEIMELLGQYPL